MVAVYSYVPCAILHTMPRKSFNNNDWRKHPFFKRLCKALLSCKTEREMADLLRDLGTLSELYSWSQRLEIARQLSEGLPYREVSEKTGESTTTVTRVARFLNDGEGGYKKFLRHK